MADTRSISALLEDARTPLSDFIERRGVPGIVVAAARGLDAPDHLVIGTDANGEPLQVDALLPVASITKLATALAILRLVDSGTISLDDPIRKHLPEVAAVRPEATVGAALSHSAGLPAWLPDGPDHEIAHGWPHLRDACIATQLTHAPRSEVLYSNVGYGLLGAIIERCSGKSYAAAVRSAVLEPLGIEGYLGVEPPRPVAIIADVRSAHDETAPDPINSMHARTVGGPWAGLVTTSAGALKLARAFLPEVGWLTRETSALALSNQTEGLSGGFFGNLIWDQCPWAAGPELHGEKYPHWAPREASPGSFGHVGASGCVVWVDTDANVAWAILGTRTYSNGWILRCSRGVGQRLIKGS